MWAASNGALCPIREREGAGEVLCSPWITPGFSSPGVSETMSWGKVIKQGWR